jgi:SNF family Na+-dependent transporter
MSWKDLICLCVVIIGVVLFLYGANYYDALIGWTGIYLIIAGFLMKIVLMVWESLKKGEDG